MITVANPLFLNSEFLKNFKAHNLFQSLSLFEKRLLLLHLSQIKFGKFGEALMMDIINKSQDLELLKTGVQELAGRSKKIDVDLIWKDKKNPEIIYFRELKGNVNFDTTNLPAVIARTNKLIEDLRVQYPGYTIDGGILHWSVYQRAALHSTTILRAIQSFEREGIKIQHMGDILKTIGFQWTEDDFYTYMRELGTMFASSLNNS